MLANDLGVTGSMAAILNEALMPNLVQTTESTPAFIHGGPFANIAHGCNSVLATRMALAMADYAVTEAGFAFDLGGEKFFDLKCRAAGLNPAAIVLVATIRALKMHGGVELDALKEADPGAVERGLANLAAHLDSASHFGKPTIVAINQFGTDTPEELKVVHDYCAGRGVPCATANVFGEGGGGAIELAEKVVAATAGPATALRPLYPLDWPAEQKIEQIARIMYGADGVSYPAGGDGQAPQGRSSSAMVNCRSAWPRRRTRSRTTPSSAAGRRGFTLTVRDIEIAAGAGFLVALTGDIVRMPGLPLAPRPSGSTSIPKGGSSVYHDSRFQIKESLFPPILESGMCNL